MKIKIRDDEIVVDQLEADSAMFGKVQALAAGDVLRLSVHGIDGTWLKSRKTESGGPVDILVPTGAMKTVWARMRAQFPDWAEVRLEGVYTGEDDDYLRMLNMLMPEWNSAEDEEAFGGLRPL